MGYSPQGHKESDMTERLTLARSVSSRVPVVPPTKIHTLKP